MNFGQHWRSPVVVSVPFRIEAPIELVIERLHADVQEWVDDARADPDPNDALEAVFRDRNWPTAKNALVDPDVMKVAAETFGFALLISFLGDGDLPATQFKLNSIGSLEVQESIVVLSGLAAPIRNLVAYQDF
jgi:hypothetical protein